MELQATAAEEQLAVADQAQQALQDRLQAEKQVRQSTSLFTSDCAVGSKRVS